MLVALAGKRMKTVTSWTLAHLEAFQKPSSTQDGLSPLALVQKTRVGFSDLLSRVDPGDVRWPKRDQTKNFTCPLPPAVAASGAGGRTTASPSLNRTLTELRLSNPSVLMPRLDRPCQADRITPCRISFTMNTHISLWCHIPKIGFMYRISILPRVPQLPIDNPTLSYSYTP